MMAAHVLMVSVTARIVQNRQRNDHDWNVAQFTCACLYAAERSI